MLNSSTGNQSSVDIQNQQQNSNLLHHGTAHGKKLNAAAIAFVPGTGRPLPEATRQLAGQQGRTDVSQHDASHQAGRERGRGKAARGTGRGRGRGGRLPAAGGLSQALGQHQGPAQHDHAPTLDGRQNGGQKQPPGTVQQPQQRRLPAAGGRQQQQQQQQHQRGEEALSGGGTDGGGGGQSVLGRSPSGRGGYLSANHLLNFQPYDRQQVPGRGGLLARGRGGRGRRGRPRSLPYNRNKFLQANFRFMVSDASDLQRHQTDADLMLDWEDVLQVEMLAQGEVQCPISLDTAPLCPQITPCGHVFAFPSIMQHLITHGGDQLRKTSPCPLCYSQIAARELRMVRVYHVARPEVGSTFTFQLLRRPRDSIIPSRVYSSRAEGSQDAKEGAAAGSDPPPSTASCGAMSAAASWACRQGIDGKEGAGGKGGTASPRRVPASLFAKYTVVSKPEPLWQVAAAELAEHAAQVTAEGGVDAAMEAPYIYAALDALAARAAAWAEHRQRSLISAAPQGAAASMLLPEAVGRQAAEVVRQFSTAAVQTSSQQITAAAEQAHRMEEFPLLTGISSPEAPAATHPGLRPRLEPLLRLASCSPDAQLPASATSQRQAGYQAAFTESEDEADPADIPASPDGVDPAEVVPDVGADQSGPIPDQPGTAAVSKAVPVKLHTAKQDGHSDSQAAAAGSLTSDGGSGAAPGSSPVGGSSAPGEFFFYQAADGQWLFLHPMNVRMLLAHAGSYASCPPQIEAKVLELEEMVQTEAVRKKLKHLDHLPATASFLLAEVDLSSVLPTAALEPFTAEVATRHQRREKKVEAEAARERREAAAAVAAAARAGQKALSARELKAMPKPSREAAVASLSETEALNVAIAESLRQGPQSETAQSADGDASGEEGPYRQPPESGVSFARIASMGFAATGPSLGFAATGPAARHTGASAWGAGGAAAQSAAPPGSSPGESSVWGANLAQQIQAAAEQSRRQGAGSDKDKKSKKGGKQMVVLGGSQRRY